MGWLQKQRLIKISVSIDECIRCSWHHLILQLTFSYLQVKKMNIAILHILDGFEYACDAMTPEYQNFPNRMTILLYHLVMIRKSYLLAIN